MLFIIPRIKFKIDVLRKSPHIITSKK